MADPLADLLTEDARGLSIDMLDVDRLREWARLLLVHGADISHWASVPHVASKLQTLATELEKAIRDIGSLRAEVAAVRGAERRWLPKGEQDMSIPRRCRLDLCTPAEKAIYAAMEAVEAMPADVRLTDAVVLLQAARNSVADYVDGIESRRFMMPDPPISASRGS